MERLRMQRIQDIINRLRKGQSERFIAEATGHTRKTVHTYHMIAREKGYLDTDKPLPEPSEIFADIVPERASTKKGSIVEPYREVVEELLGKGVEVQAIYQRISSRHGYSGSYDSVLRFVHSINPSIKKVVMRIETPCGHQAQVDFGYAGLMYDPAIKRLRKAWCFVMTLSYSRHMYVEFVFNQDMRNWINCHIHAFEYFGGVPKEIIIDNLKAAVVKPVPGNIILSEPYRRMALHYDTLISPCRIRTPEHKGKVENAVHYLKRNFLSGEVFIDVNDANRRVRIWIEEHAGIRNHGTTHEPPIKRFKEKEKSSLLPMPEKRFEIFDIKYVRVPRDCYVTINGSFYSVPYIYVGKGLEAIVREDKIEIYRGVHLITTHERAKGSGERVTKDGHHPREKAIYLKQTQEYCREKAGKTGASCLEVVNLILSEKPLNNLKGAQGILRLIDKYGGYRVEAACRRALYFGDYRYKRVRSILEADTESEPLPEINTIHRKESHEYARSIEEFFQEKEVSV